MDYTTEQLAALEVQGRRLCHTFEKIIDYGENVRIFTQRPSGESVLVERLTSLDELGAWCQKRERVTCIQEMYEPVV
jgi:hypothetical protein